MFFRQTRIHWLVNRCISNEAYDRGYGDVRLAYALLNPPHLGNVPFSQRAHVYRRRTVKEAALRLLLEYSGEWRALAEYPGEGVSSSSAGTYARIAEKAALNLARKVWFKEEDVRAQVEAAIVETYHQFLPSIQGDNSGGGLLGRR